MLEEIISKIAGDFSPAHRAGEEILPGFWASTAEEATAESPEEEGDFEEGGEE